MKILKIISAGYVAGGAENGVVKINPYFRDKGHSIKILASDMGANKKHFHDYVFKSIGPHSPIKVLLFLFHPFSFLTLKKVLKEYKPDIVHLHTMTQITPSVLFLLKKYPTVMTLHGPETFLSKLLIWYLKPSHFKNDFYDKKNLTMLGKLTYVYFNYIQKTVYRFGLKNVDAFIAPSKYIQNLAQSDVSPIIHVPNFVEARQFHELTNNYNLLFVGRLEKMKGVEFLIQAMAFIIKAFPQATLTIIGDGSAKTALLNTVKDLQMDKYIQFIGWMENKELDTYYEKASIVVIPSFWPENFPTVCNEAMSIGRPVIGTNIGGIPEIIDDGVNGYLVEPQNPAQIAEKVCNLFLEGELLIKMGRNARKKAEVFSIEKHMEDVEAVYKGILNKYELKNCPNHK